MNSANQSLSNYPNAISFVPTHILRDLKNWYIDRANRKSTLAYLNGLSGRELRDIGLTPSELAKMCS